LSFDIHLQCFRNGKPATFKRALFEEIFGRGAVNLSLPLTDVRYPDGSGAQIYGADGADDISSLMFNHCGGATFYDRLYELAHRTRSAVLWPFGNPQSAVTDAKTIAGSPGLWEEPLGPAIVVTSGRELAEGIQRCLLVDKS
jgi:hypothetical protein